VGAETSDGLLAGLSRVAERLDVADPEGDSAESARRLREHLTSRAGRGLLVFDNAVDPDGLRLFLPAAGGTQIVVTSTDRSFAELGEMVEVSVFIWDGSAGYQWLSCSVVFRAGTMPMQLRQRYCCRSR
jgi:hypothetical protein